MLDILEIDEVASALKKSPSWVYANAARLGASKVGGSLIFSKSALVQALESARLKVKEVVKSEPVQPAKKKTRSRATPHNTDPEAHGLHHILSLLGSQDDGEDIFAGLDFEAILAALKK